MWPYWIMFILPAAFALQEASKSYRSPILQNGLPVAIPGSWWIILVVYTALIGWRFEVGGDWGNYLANFQFAVENYRYADWWWDDPGFRLFEWIGVRTGWGVIGVNLLSAAVFSYGLVLFCRHLPRPWLAFTVAVPYLVIILGMGYTRQGIALGCIMAGLVALGNGNIRKFLVWAVLGALFHKSAVLVLPIAALAGSKNRWWSAIWVGVVIVSSYVLLLEDSVDTLREGYLEAQYKSEGAFIRLLMNLLPALVLLVYRKRFAFSIPQQRLWFWFAVGAVATFALYYISPSSTAVDRIGLYLLPLQLMVFAYFPEIMGRSDGRGNLYWVLAVVFYYAAVEFVWLNYASHAAYWIPYRWYPLELIQ
jgi:hypothetical protein